MRVDKYVDMALRNPQGLAWWNLCSDYKDLTRWLRIKGCFKYYGFVDCIGIRDTQVSSRELQLVKKLVAIAVWDIGMNSWWNRPGVPTMDYRVEDTYQLERDLRALRLEYTNGERVRGGFIGGQLTEMVYLDMWLETYRKQVLGG